MAKSYPNGRNCLLRAISSFLTVFSKGLIPRGIIRGRQKVSLCGNGLKAFKFLLLLPCFLMWDCKYRVNSLPDHKILAFSQLKAFADNKCHSNAITENIEVCVGKNRKHCWKRMICWLPAFYPFPTMFSKASFSRGVKSWDCVVKA